MKKKVFVYITRFAMLRYLALVLILSAAPKTGSQTLDWRKILIAEMQKDTDQYEDCLILKKEDGTEIVTIHEAESKTIGGHFYHIVSGFTCLSGTAGTDIGGIYISENEKVVDKLKEPKGVPWYVLVKLKKQHQLEYFRSSDSSYAFEGDWIVHRALGVRTGDANCCPSGGELITYYKVEGKKLSYLKFKYELPVKPSK